MKARPNTTRFRGVRLERVRPDSLRAFLTSVKVAFKENDKPVLLLERYLDHMTDAQRTMTGRDRVGRCEQCLAVCPTSVEACPVCETGAKAETPPPTAQDLALAEKKLEDRVVEIRSLMVEGSVNALRLGKILLETYESGLYKARLGPDLKPLYPSWDAFSMGEFGISGSRTNVFMSVAEQGYTEEQVRSVGSIEKLRAISKLNPADRPAMLVKAPGLSTRELNRIVSRNLPKLPAPSGGREVGLRLGADAAKRAAERRARLAEGSAITVHFQMTEFELPMNRTPQGFMATDLTVNGVRVTYTVSLKGKNKAVMKVKYARVDEEGG